MPIVFGKQISAHRETFGQISLPLLFEALSEGQRETFGELAFPIDFESIIESGIVTVHGQLALDLILAITTAGKIKLPGVILNEAINLYLGEQQILAAYFGSEQIWP
jgi:hypothetical protein